MKFQIRGLGACLLVASFTLLGPAGDRVVRGDDLAQALGSLSGDRVLDHIKTLASDAFEGRGPGTTGEAKTVAYLVDTFRSNGLKPGNPDGTYLQDVPLVGFQATKTAGLIKFADGKTIPLTSPAEWVGVSRRFRAETVVEGSDVVFVGYGVVAPEYGWDDYKGVDVRGKTVVMLINDPAVPDPADAVEARPRLFQAERR